MQALSNFVLRDSFPVQMALYTIPGVHIFARLFQSHHSLDLVAKNNNKIAQFNERKEHFQKHMTNAIQIQTAVAVMAFVTCIIFPATIPVGSFVININLTLAASNFLFDKFCRATAPHITGSYTATGW
jgi:uncharacterized membrane protein SpoIIM required for sporulation